MAQTCENFQNPQNFENLGLRCMGCMKNKKRDKFRPHANKLIKLKGQKWDWRLDFGGLGQKGSREVKEKSKRECMKWIRLSHEYV